MKNNTPAKLRPTEMAAWERLQAVGEDFQRLSMEDQQVLTQLIERQLKGGSAHFREHAEAFLADGLGEELAGLLVGREEESDKR